MKKNEIATFIVYLLMLGIAALVGFLVINPFSRDYLSNPWIVVIVSMIVGLVLNAVLLEVGHLLGALAGKLKIEMWVIFGLGIKAKNGKFRFVATGYDGLTGETKVTPKDPEKSSFSAYILFPMLFIVLEAIAVAIIGAIAYSKPTDLGWLYVASIVVMTTGAMITVYNIFPAHLDTDTDGYRMMLLSKPANKLAYNQYLIIKNEKGESAIFDMPVYDEITEFTAEINMINVYKQLAAKDYVGALKIVQKTIDADKGISFATKAYAEIMKLSIVLMTTKKEDGARYYDTVPDDIRKTISSLNDAPSLRSYLLISGVLEGSENEFQYGLGKAERVLKKDILGGKEIEKTLYGYCLTRVKTLHPDWTVEDPLEEKQETNKTAE
ncbi:MAG: hypothetical protein MJ239_01140 [Bacilli bacterium]|nr:hypothetical protein [Bacilli bacterium]